MKEWLFYKNFFKEDYSLVKDRLAKKLPVKIFYNKYFIKIINSKFDIDLTLQSNHFIVDGSKEKKIIMFVDFNKYKGTHWEKYIMIVKTNGVLEFFKNWYFLTDKPEFILNPN